MMGALEFMEDRDSRKPFDASKKMGEKIHVEAAKRGLWSRVKEDTYVLAPPLTTSKDGM